MDTLLYEFATKVMPAAAPDFFKNLPYAVMIYLAIRYLIMQWNSILKIGDNRYLTRSDAEEMYVRKNACHTHIDDLKDTTTKLFEELKLMIQGLSDRFDRHIDK